MHMVVDKLMSHSHLKYKGLKDIYTYIFHLFSHKYTLDLVQRRGVKKYVIGFPGTLSMLDCNIFPGLGHDYLGTEVNMFLLPVQEPEEDNLTKAGQCVSMQRKRNPGCSTSVTGY